ncbi:MAG: uroporphyrinogen-III C-methyltransferase [Candidatus Omnitrophica bacterium]|nr:uroporphyrinogen-III C-methyltransferase [Candidatus Omnitrophota bacterium]
MKKTGKVYLVGAGPGDPGLITFKGIQCLKKADIVLYDALVNSRLLEWAPQAEKIYVGKRGGHTSITQKEIERLLIRHAQEGKTVVRLKGGDPYLFGRGAEEVEELVARKIQFEIVPGVTSALAAPCYAGIPLTHRKWSSSVAIATGHEDPDKPQSTLRLEELAQGADTLVLLMAVSQLKEITQRLLKSGRKKTTPAALVEWGTTLHQRIVTGTLANILQKAKQSGMKPPSVFVVGDVVRLRQSLNWFEKRPLFGKRILVTRAARQIPEFRALLEEQGASTVDLPMIEIVPANPGGFKNRMEYESYDWVVFTSSNGVEQFLTRLKEMEMDIRVLKKAKICAIGPKTAERLKTAQLKVDLVPEKEFRAEGILQAFSQWGSVLDKRIVLIRAEEGRDVLPDGLREMGAEVEQISIYQTEPVKHPPSVVRQIKKELTQRKIHAVTFTSPSSVNSFLSSFGKEALKRTKVASLGPVTSAALKEAKVHVAIEAHPYTIEGLTEALVRRL